MAASIVLGQSDFSTSTNNAGGLSASSLSVPEGVAVDSSGNLYVADTGNHRVLEYNTPLTTDRTADRFFGQPDFFSNGSNTGGLSPSSLSVPEGVAVDSSGNLYVADAGNNRVLEYNTPLASDTTADRVFGQGGVFTTNTCNKTALNASSLCFPEGIALDSSDNLYVADTNNNRVLEYHTPLTITAVAGSGDTTADIVFGQGGVFTTNTCNKTALNVDSLCFPEGVTRDSSDNLYVADTSNSRVLEYYTPLTVTLVPGSGDTTADVVLGQLAFTTNGINFVDAAGLNTLKGAAVDATADPDGNSANGIGILYVADTANNRILGFSNLSAWTTGTSTGLNTSTTLNDTTQSFTLNQFVGFTVQITGGTGAGQVRTITGNTATQLTVSPSWTTIPDSTSTYQITAAASTVIGQTDMNSNLCNQGGSVSATSLCGPRGVAVDSSGHLYVADTNNNRVLEYDTPLTSGTANHVFGQGDLFAPVSGPPLNPANTCNNIAPVVGGLSAKSLCFPEGVAVDSAGNLYIADTGNNRVLEYHTPLTITAVAGSGDTTADIVFGQPSPTTNPSPCNNSAAAIGGLSAKSLCFPEGVVLDSNDNLYVADTDNNRVLEYDTPLLIVASGTSTGGNTSTILNDTTKSFTPNQFVNFLVEITGGTGAGQARTIISNTATQLTVSSPWTTTPDSTSTYQIRVGTVADDVFGQPSFFSNAINANNPGIPPPPNATSLFFPAGVAVDSTDNLYVADTNNNRVLEYDTPLITDTVADDVFGQPDFTSSDCNNPNAAIGGLSDKSLCFPDGVALDTATPPNLYVADTSNNRVLRFP